MSSAYNHGIMGYRTPNIDQIAKEGAMFTDWYGEQSCTAGRAAFVTAQSPIRTGLTKVGLPGADIGLRAEDMSVAEARLIAAFEGVGAQLEQFRHTQIREIPLPYTDALVVLLLETTFQSLMRMATSSPSSFQ